jgi:hypothetical protein
MSHPKTVRELSAWLATEFFDTITNCNDSLSQIYSET